MLGHGSSSRRPNSPHGRPFVFELNYPRLAFGSGKSIVVRDLADREVRDTIYVGTEDIESVDPTDWSVDGKYLLVNLESDGATNSNISYLDLESGQLHKFLSNDVDNDYARLSPDGRWLVYEFGPPGRSDVVIRPFPDGEGSLTVAIGAQKPIWRQDGRAILYSKLSDGRIFETEIMENLSDTFIWISERTKRERIIPGQSGPRHTTRIFWPFPIYTQRLEENGEWGEAVRLQIESMELWMDSPDSHPWNKSGSASKPADA